MLQLNSASLSRQNSFTALPVDEAEAQKACMSFSCEIRGIVADALRRNQQSWSGTSWMQKFDLVKAEQRKKDDEETRRRGASSSVRRASVIQMLATGLHSMHQPSVVNVQQAAQSRLRSFRLLAKKALWKHRKAALAQRSSIWWCVETHCRVENTRSFFENINNAQNVEGVPAINPDARLKKLVASVPSHAIFPSTQANQAPAEDPELDSATSAELSAAAVDMPPLMIHPHSSFRSAWDILTLFLLLYCVFSIPFQMSFSSDVPKYYIVPGTEDDLESVAEVVDVVDYIDLFVDAAFMVDVVINLRTAFLRPHATRSMVLETRGHVVAMRYFKTSFVPDVVSSLPYQWITPIINEVAGFSKVPRLFKLIRLLRLIKFMRLNRVTRTASNFKSSVGMSHAVFRGISFVIVFFLTVHIIACCLYFAGTLYYRDSRGVFKSWLAGTSVFDGEYTRLMDAPPGTRYLYSLYWAIAIVETIGYGDIKPAQSLTVVMLLIVMLTGVFIFSYLMGNVASIVHLFYGLEEKTSVLREDIQRFNFDQKIPHPIAERLDAWFMQQYGTSSLVTKTAVYDELPNFIKPEIALRSFMHHLVENELFREACGVMQPDASPAAKDLHTRLTHRLSRMLRYKVFGGGDEVLGESKTISSVYFVLHGKICVFQPGCFRCSNASGAPSNNNSSTNRSRAPSCACVPVFSAGKGFIVGELAMVQGSHRSAHTYTAVGRVIVQELTRKDWLELLNCGEFRADLLGDRLTACIVERHERLELGIRISKEVFKLKSRRPADAAVTSQDCGGFPNDSTAASSALPQSEAGVNPTQLTSLLRLHSKYKQINHGDAVSDSLGHAHEGDNMAHFKKQLEVQHDLCELRDKLSDQIRAHHAMYEEVADCVFGLQALKLAFDDADHS